MDRQHNSAIIYIRSPMTPMSPELILQDITFLQQFRKHVAERQPPQLEELLAGPEVGGRYSLIDRNLNTVEPKDQVITELWKISGNKADNALMGKMDSCDVETNRESTNTSSNRRTGEET